MIGTLNNLMEAKIKQLNFNTFIGFITLAAVTWVGVTLTANTKDINEMKQRMAVMEAANPYKVDQMNRIENEQGRARTQLISLQEELQNLKH